ncbi:MAG: histone deacetylase [Chloroflexi bacterium]|nr:histone deacetylase [Chloroflexota bacterium]
MTRQLGLVYDPRFLEHDQPFHPENAQRLKAIIGGLEEAGIWDKTVNIKTTPIAEGFLFRIHKPHYVDSIRKFAGSGGGMLDINTYLNSQSYQVALLAAGGAVQAAEAVLSGKVEQAFALVRPPGHHAHPSRAGGFCLFNNIALAAEHAIHNLGLERVLVVDFDVHHGDGTQAIFYSRKDVLYFSTHQYPLFPGTGHWKEIGEGPGEGFTINVPLPAGLGYEAYPRVFAEILFPAANRYRPELILVSAGYDAHWRDPLAGMRLSTKGFARLTRMLLDLAEEHCSGKMVLVLEGGYDLPALSASVAATCAVILGEDPQDSLGQSAETPYPLDDLLSKIKEIHRLA